MKDEVKTAFVKHMNAEFEAFYLYLSMHGWFEDKSWPGFGAWMATQAQEEQMHAMKFYTHLLERGEFPKLLSIPEPKDNWNSVLEIFEDSLAHEKKVTALIHDLYHLAIEQKDLATQRFLDWFIDEQVEEEANVSGIVDRLSRIQDDPKGLMMMDNELGGRTAEE